MTAWALLPYKTDEHVASFTCLLFELPQDEEQC